VKQAGITARGEGTVLRRERKKKKLFELFPKIHFYSNTEFTLDSNLGSFPGVKWPVHEVDHST